MNFNNIAARYAKDSLVQHSAAQILLDMVEIKDPESVLDLGCGPGHITKIISQRTTGMVMGVDPSEGMLSQARDLTTDMAITFEQQSAETISYEALFDVIICNSAMQWFKKPEQALTNCFRALKSGGRLAVQAPATQNYCPQFVKVIKTVANEPKVGAVFKYWKNPWWFLESATAYKERFEEQGFQVGFSQIQALKSNHTPDEAFKVFASGAIAGYLSPEYYDAPWPVDYEQAFKSAIKEALNQQAGDNQKIELEFNRIFLIAKKNNF